VAESDGFRIDAFYKPASVTSADDSFDIGETFRSANGLEMSKMENVSGGTSAVCFASLLCFFRRIASSLDCCSVR